MRRIIFCLLLNVIGLSVSAFESEVKPVRLTDGEEVMTRLCLPDSAPPRTIVFCVSGTGPSTYLMKRPKFNYCDELADGFCRQGIAFFTYDRRGCQSDDTPPLYVAVDSVKYAKYTPMQEAKDVEDLISSLLQDVRWRDCKLILYGISEGTIIASLVAERANVRVDALFLHGYAHDNMYDVIKWQNEGHGVMILVNSVFDHNGDSRVDRKEYDTPRKEMAAYKSYLFQNQPFDSLDVVKDDFIDIQDIQKMRKPFNEQLMKCITEDNGYWIKNNYFNITPQWFKTHFELEPNKTRLMRLNIPIHIFHGVKDANVPVEGVYDLEARFKVNNMQNLTIHVFESHDHGLNFVEWLTKKKWSQGYSCLFETAKELGD